MSRYKKISRLPGTKPRIVICFAPVALLYLALLGRASMLQLLPHAKLEQFMQRLKPSSMSFSASRRGLILDRNGRELAIDVARQSIYVDPLMLKQAPQWQHKLRKVATWTNSAWQPLLRKINSGSRFVWVERQVKPEIAERIRQLQLHGLYFIDESQRTYPNGMLAAELLGFTNLDGQGIEGLEYQYNQLLQGKDGALRGQRDAKGRKLLVGGIETYGVSAQNLTISIDSVLQYMLESELARAMQETRAVGAMGAIMNPQNGEMLAMGMRPSFDPNQYGKYAPSSWRNRLVSDTFEPGSIFKSLVVAYALERGLLNEKERFYCKYGSFSVGNRLVNEVHRELGWLNPSEILKYSSNIGAAQIALKLGNKNMASMLSDFGFGSKTMVGLPGEAIGLLQPHQRWTSVDLAASGFGQGIGVTVMQMLSAYAALANGGDLVQPFIALHATNPETQERTLIGQRRVRHTPLSPRISQNVRRMLTEVVEVEGTGSRAALANYSVGGKTGTAQRFDTQTARYMKNTYVSSFIGYLPLDNPQLLIMIVIDQPQGGLTSGGMVAAPVFRRVAEQAAGYLHIEPDLPATLAMAAKPLSPTIKTAALLGSDDENSFDQISDLALKQSVRGLTVRQVLNLAQKHGFEIAILGSGFATGKVEPDRSNPKKFRVEFQPRGKY